MCEMVTISAVQMLFLPVSSVSGPQYWWPGLSRPESVSHCLLLPSRPASETAARRKTRVMTENFHQQTQNLQCSVIIQVGFHIWQSYKWLLQWLANIFHDVLTLSLGHRRNGVMCTVHAATGGESRGQPTLLGNRKLSHLDRSLHFYDDHNNHHYHS